ncbi:hypothetical protein [Leifsonia sp. NPDC080035]|uniref:Uncharacterized protein n=1 Tax=Leifsonia sp. NPDC080035 TaxID=3143936 RepID=A0AAU7G899_9MICO
MSDEFADAFRDRVTEHIRSGPAPLAHRRVLIGAGVALGLVVGGAAAATATGLLATPGAQVTTPLQESRTVTSTGSGSVELGAMPKDATGATLSFRCLSLGTFVFDDGAGVTCTRTDDFRRPTTYFLGRSAIHGGRVTVTTSEGAGWTLTAAYASSETTAWGVNDSGQSYGAINDRGAPDLVAVTATNGRDGFVRRTDLEDADGTTAARSFTSPADALRWQEQNRGVVHRIPVFEADGTTRVGEFAIGG